MNPELQSDHNRVFEETRFYVPYAENQDGTLLHNPWMWAKDAEAPFYELLIGYAFWSDCICNGFFHLKSTPRMVHWLQELLIWLYNHPYEHDQRAMSAFLNYTERVSFPKKDK